MFLKRLNFLKGILLMVFFSILIFSNYTLVQGAKDTLKIYPKIDSVITYKGGILWLRWLKSVDYKVSWSLYKEDSLKTRLDDTTLLYKINCYKEDTSNQDGSSGIIPGTSYTFENKKPRVQYIFKVLGFDKKQLNREIVSGIAKYIYPPPDDSGENGSLWILIWDAFKNSSPPGKTSFILIIILFLISVEFWSRSCITLKSIKMFPTGKEIENSDKFNEMLIKGIFKDNIEKEYLGIKIKDINEETKEKLKIQGGVIISEVDSRGTACKAGLVDDDIVIQFNSKNFKNSVEFRELLFNSYPDSTVNLKIYKKGIVPVIVNKNAKEEKEIIERLKAILPPREEFYGDHLKIYLKNRLLNWIIGKRIYTIPPRNKKGMKFEELPSLKILHAGITAYNKSKPHASNERIMNALKSRKDAEDKELERRSYVDWIWSLGFTEPLLGLFGTVTGLVQAFNKYKHGGSVSDFSAGISEALWTTVFGLTAGIILMLVYYYYNNKLERISSSWHVMYVDFSEHF